jgi:hypothetical protein
MYQNINPGGRGEEGQVSLRGFEKNSTLPQNPGLSITANLQMEVILSSFVRQPRVIIKEVGFVNSLPCTITIVVNSGCFTFSFFSLPYTVPQIY